MRRPVLRFIMVLPGALVLAGPLSAPLGAQVTRPPVTSATPERRLPVVPGGDLVITGLQLHIDGSGVIAARLTIKNQGEALVTIPANTPIARGDAQAGAVTFPVLKAEDGYALHPGTTTQVSVRSDGWCSGGKPGAVVFRVDPDGVIGEKNEANNTYSLTAQALAGDIKLLNVWLESDRVPVNPITRFIEPAQRNILPRGAGASIGADIQNGGPGFVVVCPGTALLRDVQSPVSAMYGLRTYSTQEYFTLAPGGGRSIRLVSAVGGIVLDPGNYPWQFVINPQGTILDANAGNNTASATVRVVPQQ